MVFGVWEGMRAKNGRSHLSLAHELSGRISYTKQLTHMPLIAFQKPTACFMASLTTMMQSTILIEEFSLDNIIEPGSRSGENLRTMAEEPLPVVLMTASLLALDRVSLVTGSMANPSSPSGTLVKLTVIKSFSLSLLPVAGQMVSMEGLASAALASGVLEGSQKAFISYMDVSAYDSPADAGALAVLWLLSIAMSEADWERRVDDM